MANYRWIKLSLGVVLTLAATTPARAQRAGKGAGGGQMTQRLQQAFTQGDANKDGFLDHQEFFAALKALHSGSHSKGQSQSGKGSQAAKNGNGAQHHPFKEADKNGDGKVSLQEFQQFIVAKVKQHAAKGGGQGTGGGGIGKGRPAAAAAGS